MARAFSSAGTSCVLQARTVTSTDNYGKNTYTNGTATTTNMLPYNLSPREALFYSWGTITENEADILLPSTVTPGDNDQITLNNITYFIKQRQEYEISGVAVAWLCRIAKQIP